jgi:hypothetical protein
VEDTTPPVITCPEDITVECAADVPPANTEDVSATDNCGIAIIGFIDDTTIDSTCANRFTVLRVYQASDECGNTATCTQTIEVFDDTPPMITCPANVTVECAADVPPVNTEAVITSDNCVDTPTVTHVSDVISNMTCTNRFVVTRTYRSTDVCGNSATCEQIITVFDDTPPMITCPANITVECAADVPPVNIGAVTATDNCAGTVTITHVSDVVSNMTCLNRFTLTRTYRATDVCGNSSTCAQIIQVFDDTPPMITCPANVTVQCASQVPPVNIGSVTATDNCAGTVTITHVSDVITNMTCVNRFTLTRTYRATDACGNSATCAQIIQVFDNTAPTLTCPANVTVQCAEDVPPVNTGSVTASDNCNGTVTITHVSDVISNMTCINRFILTRTYRATDECGNSATCTQVITVFDNTPPVIEFTDPLLEGVPNGGTIQVQCFGQDPEWELPTFDENSVEATDNCAGPVTVTYSDILVDEGDCDVDGYINRYRLNWTATDACGNSSTAFVFLELIDTIPPVIIGVPNDTIVNCDEIPEPPAVMATDECLCACIIEYEQSEPDPGCQDGQIITRTWTAEDDCGNVTVVVQNITLIDNEGPEIIMMVPELQGVPDGAILEYTCNEGGIPEFFDELSGESVFSPVSCGSAGVISFNENTIIANNCKFWGYIESRTYRWSAVDACGNTTSLTITAHLIDDEPPVILNVPDMACVDDPILDEVDIVDNCEHPFLAYWDDEIPNPCGDGMAIMRTYEGYDDCGNFVRDTAILIPNDKSHPDMGFVNPILADIEFGEVLEVDCDLQENGNYTPFTVDDVTVSDDCMGGVHMHFAEEVIEQGDCSNGIVAVLDLVWTATDICGNLSELRIRAHVMDQTPPQLVNFEVEITIECGDDLPEVEATDNCSEVSITSIDSIVQGPCVFEYDVLRRIMVTDACGNRTQRTQIIHVGDGSGPIIEGVEEEVCDDLSIPEVTAWDPCAGEFVEVTMTEDTLDVPCADGLVIERVWTAVDACGHVSEIRQRIILGDQTPPEILIPTNSVIRRFYGIPYNLVFTSQEDIMNRLNALDETSIFVLDDCDTEIEPVFTVDVVYADNCEEDGYFERRTYRWIATDVCGNSSEISFTVDIMDDVAPTLEGVPNDTTVVCNDLPPAPVVTANDPAEPVIVEYFENIESGDGPGSYNVFRRWVATDACGNVAAATQVIVWIPVTLASCDILLPEAVECNSHGVLIGSDQQGGVGPLTYMWEVTGEKCFIQSGQGTSEILIYVGWSEVEISLTITDAFGCSTVCNATLNCLDPIEESIVEIPQVHPEITPAAPADAVNGNLSADILHHFNLWPNPANTTINLSFESAKPHEANVRMLNFLGQVVLSQDISAIKGFNSKKLDVSHLPEGSYLLELVTEFETETKIVVLFRTK